MSIIRRIGATALGKPRSAAWFMKSQREARLNECFSRPSPAYGRRGTAIRRSSLRSHSASSKARLLWFPRKLRRLFALIAYASNYVKCHFPDVFCAALPNSQPMDFHAPAQIVADARKHGVEIRPVCINRSRWDCAPGPVEGRHRHAVRLGMRLVRGIGDCRRGTHWTWLQSAQKRRP